MFTRPPDLSDSTVVSALERGWSLAVDDIAYQAVGFGSHHWRARSDVRTWFVTVDDLDAKRLSEHDTRQAAAQRLTVAMETASSLHDHGLDFVAAPITSDRGLVSEPIDDRFVLSVFDYVAGDTYTFGAYPTPAARLAVLDRLAELHKVPAAATPALEEGFEIPRREVVASLSAGSVGFVGPYTQDAWKLLTRHRASLARAFDRFDSMVRVVRADRSKWVVTHGEPHQANTINTWDRGVILIDWDTVLIAPPERDLWTLVGEDDAIARTYSELTEHVVDADVVGLYAMFWDLTEICLYAADFLAPHEQTADTELAWESFQQYLDPSRWTPAG